jgi:hypothetical protein
MANLHATKRLYLGLEAWLKWQSSCLANAKALSSNSSPIKKIKKRLYLYLYTFMPIIAQSLISLVTAVLYANEGLCFHQSQDCCWATRGSPSPLAWVEVAAGSSPKLVMAKHLVNAVYCDSTFRVGLMLW